MSDNATAEYEYKDTTLVSAHGYASADAVVNVRALDALRKEQHVANLLKVIELSSRDDVPDAVYDSTGAAVAKLQALGVLA